MSHRMPEFLSHAYQYPVNAVAGKSTQISTAEMFEAISHAYTYALLNVVDLISLRVQGLPLDGDQIGTGPEGTWLLTAKQGRQKELIDMQGEAIGIKAVTTYRMGGSGWEIGPSQGEYYLGIKIGESPEAFVGMSGPDADTSMVVHDGVRRSDELAIDYEELQETGEFQVRVLAGNIEEQLRK